MTRYADKLEPEAAELLTYAGADLHPLAATVSIAISLKRLADRLCGNYAPAPPRPEPKPMVRR